MFDQDKACALLADGYTLRQTAEQVGVTSGAISARVLDDAHFAAQYARAMSVRADVLADEIVDIAEDGRNDWEERENKDGSTYTALNREAIERSRLRMDARKWIASKLKPKKYGDRMQSDIDLAVTVTVVNPFQIAQEVAQATIASQPAIESDT